MTTLTAEEFLEITRKNPQWTKALTDNVAIVGKVVLPVNHPLKALSPKLIFHDYADFRNSRITVAEGVFHRAVNFACSKLQDIGELSVLGTDEKGNAASFYNCETLAVAKGTFYGYVNFAYSGVREIAEDLHIAAPNKKGNASHFWACKHLAVAKGTFPGWVNFSFSAIHSIAENLHVTNPNKWGNAADFRNCKNLHVASGTFQGTVNFTATPITHAQHLQITAAKKKPKAIFTELCLKDLPFPKKDVLLSEKLVKQLRLRDLHRKLKTRLPNLPQGI